MKVRNLQYLNELNILKKKEKKKIKKAIKKIINKVNLLNFSLQFIFFFNNLNLFSFQWKDSNVNDKML